MPCQSYGEGIEGRKGIALETTVTVHPNAVSSIALCVAGTNDEGWDACAVFAGEEDLVHRKALGCRGSDEFAESGGAVGAEAVDVDSTGIDECFVTEGDGSEVFVGFNIVGGAVVVGEGVEDFGWVCGSTFDNADNMLYMIR